MKLIQSKYAGRCATCGGNIEAGASIWFDGNASKGNKAHHEGCRAIPKDAPAPKAPAAPRTNTPHYKALAGITTMPTSNAPIPKDLVAEHFDDLQAFFAPRPMLDLNRDAFEKSGISGTNREYWLGLPTANAVMDAIKDGWTDGARRMLDALGKIKATTTAASIRRVLCRDDHGDEIDIHRVLAGSFDRAWTRRKRGLRRTTRAVTIVLDSGANCNIDADKLFWRGAAALCLSELLSEAGYSVAIIVGANSAGLDVATSKTRYQYSVAVKKSHQPLDVEALAAATALPGFFRVGGFRKFCERPYRVQSNLGHSQPLDMTKIDAENPVLVPSNVFGQQQAEDWLRKAVEELTGEPATA